MSQSLVSQILDHQKIQQEISQITNEQLLSKYFAWDVAQVPNYQIRPDKYFYFFTILRLPQVGTILEIIRNEIYLVFPI